MRIDGEHWDALCADFDAALAELTAPLAGRSDLWNVGPAGKWTAGQIVDHVATTTERYAEWFDAALVELKAGTLRGRGMRWPHQALICAIVINAGKFPSGGRSPTPFVPADLPKRDQTMARLARAVTRHREIGRGLSAAERDRLWVANAIFGGLALPEAMRLHAVHARHHTRQVARIAA